MKLILDTNIYSDYAEGLPETVDFLATHGEYLYVYSGILHGNRGKANELAREDIRKF